MKFLWTAALLFCATSFSAIAEPVSTHFAIDALSGTSHCSWNSANTQCRWRLNNYNGNTTITPTSAISETANDQYGYGKAWGRIDPASYLPELHAYARSNARNGMVDTNVWGVQGYEYVGESPFLLTLTVIFDSVFSIPSTVANAFDHHSGFYVSIFGQQNYSFEYMDAGTLSNGDTLCPIRHPNESYPESGYCSNPPQAYDFASYFLTSTGGVEIELQHLLNPGDRFFVGAYLDAAVCCNGIVDSSHTLRMQFAPEAIAFLQSTPVPGAVPLPPSLALFGLGVVLLSVRRLSGMRQRLPN